MPEAKSVKPTQEELDDLGSAAQRLWDLDINRFEAGTDYRINLQEGKKYHDRADKADGKLFEMVNKQRFFETPTFKCFYNLLDNYEPETGVEETVTQQEKQENWDFIHAICDTHCIKYLHAYLEEKNLAKADLNEFKRQLYQIWFTLYRRETRNDSSGFEHVFIGEIRDEQVIGFHNWVRFFIEELKGNVDYKGWVFPRSRKTEVNSESRLITVNFDWTGHEKMGSSSFIGTSPEFEIALYTLFFLSGEVDNKCELGGYNVNIKCHKIKSKYGDKIGTSYPICED